MSTENKELQTASQLPLITTGLTAKSILSMDISDIHDFVSKATEHYLDGHNDPTEAAVIATKLIKMGELLKANTADACANSLRLGNGETETRYGCKIAMQMTGVRYSYDDTGNTRYLRLKELVKAEENIMRGIKGKQTIVDEETGEAMEVREPVKSGKLSPVITIK